MPTALRQLLVGTKAGLIVLEPRDRSWHQAAHILRGEWITSINPTARGYEGHIVTTRSGLIASIASHEIHVVGNLRTRLWFATRLPHGPLCVGTSNGELLIETDFGRWESVDSIRGISEYGSWHSHSGGHAHLHSLLIDQANSCLYTATEVGGILRGAMDLSTWEDITANLDPDVHSIVMNPRDHKTIFAATGSGVFSLTAKARHWENLGSPSLSYVQGIVHHPSQDLLYISAARSPFGRYADDFSGTRPTNDFAILSSADHGRSWRIPSSDCERLGGVLSKAIALEPNPPYSLFAGSIDGKTIQLSSTGDCSLIAEGMGHIECIGFSRD